jgi:hypothetical protein
MISLIKNKLLFKWMLDLNLYKNFRINNYFFVKFLFYSFPVILLFPSGYITAHVSLLSIASILLIYKNNLKIKLLLVDYFVFLFFFLSIFSTLKNITILGNIIFIKSILDLRFAIFFLIIRIILNNEIVNLKILSIISLLASFFLSLDIFLQHLIGHDILGFKPFDGRYNGFFEHEAIAGSYIQKFFLLSLLVIFLLDLKKFKKFFLTTFIINILGLGTLLSLDRMPFLIFIFILFILLIFLRNFRILLISNIIILSILSICLIKKSEVIKLRYEYFNRDINFSKILDMPIIKNNIKNLENENNITVINKKLFYGDYSKLYNAAYLVSLNNYMIGNGVKSFIYECAKLPPNTSHISCNNHPHNIYLEILVNLGLIGLSLFIVILFLLINKIIKFLSINNINNKVKITQILFLTFFIAELVPFRSYGSIFQTVNGSIFWFFLAIMNYINNLVIKK